MRQKDNIEVWLECHDDRLTLEREVEYAYDFIEHGGCTRKAKACFINEEAGVTFKPIIKFHRHFDLCGVSGVKITIAVGHRQQQPGSMNDVQAWFLPEASLQESMKRGGSFTFGAIQKWDRDRMSREAFTFPEPGGK